MRKKEALSSHKSEATGASLIPLVKASLVTLFPGRRVTVATSSNVLLNTFCPYTPLKAKLRLQFYNQSCCSIHK